MADGTLKVGQITTSSGSGTITVGASGETVDFSNGTVTLNSSMKNTPNFFVQSNGSAQTLNHATHTKVTVWATPAIDTASNWDSTNSRYVFDTAGKYLVQASLYFVIDAFNKRLQMSVRKNGSAHILSTVSSGKNNSANVAYMNEYAVSDYLEIFGYQDQSSGNISMATEAVMTFLNITKIIE